MALNVLRLVTVSVTKNGADMLILLLLVLEKYSNQLRIAAKMLTDEEESYLEDRTNEYESALNRDRKLPDSTVNWTGESIATVILAIIWFAFIRGSKKDSKRRIGFFSFLVVCAWDSYLKIPDAITKGSETTAFHLFFTILPFVVSRRVLGK
jgi:hypothetical protein